MGEFNYQGVVSKLPGEHGTDNAYVKCTAELDPKEDNKYDPKAMAVTIEDLLVGYMSKDDVRSFRGDPGTKKLTGELTSCDAVIVKGATGRLENYGVKLDLKPLG